MDDGGTRRVRGFRAPGPDEATAAEPARTPAEVVAPRPADQPVTGEAMQAGPALPRPARPAWTRRWTRGDQPRTGSGRSGETDRIDRPSWRLLILTGAVLVVAITVIAVLAFRLGSAGGSDPAAGSTASPTADPSASARASATPVPTTELYRRLVPSVVLITTSKGSLGSGTVVTDTGTILTANHVISGGGRVSVQFADGTKTTASVASRSTGTDTATLVPAKLPEVVVPATVGGGAAVGADVVAIGNPLGLRDSTSTGVVSGLGRTNKTSAGTISGLIQFDAAVNPGSSGGPLLDDHGNLIGVVLSIADPGEDDAFAGIGFAVPIGSALGGGGGTGAGGGPQL